MSDTDPFAGANTGNPDTGNPDPGNPDTGNPDPGNPDTGNPDPGNPDPTETPLSADSSPQSLGVPEGTVREILDWVGVDEERAWRALAEEEAAETPRRSLVSSLRRMLE